MARVSTSKVICFYANPNGTVEKHELSSVSFEEASRPKTLQGPRGRPIPHKNGEEHLWTLEPPKGCKHEEIIDFTPAPFDVKAMDSAPPPALQRDSLRERPSARG